MGDGRAEAALAGFAALVLLAFGPAPAFAQTPVAAEWATLDQRVEVDMGAGDGSADVVVRYRLGAGEEGAPLPSARPITFELLGFGDATAQEIELLRSGGDRRAGGGGGTEGGGAEAGGAERVVLWPTVGSHRVAVIEPPPAGDAETLSLTVSYRVADVIERRKGDTSGVIGGTAGRDAGAAGPAELVHARIPVLTGPPVRAASGGDAFDARLTVPAEWAVTEGFPSRLRRVDDGVWAVSLTVAPSVVGFRASTDGRWRPGFPLLVDLLTLVILAVFLVGGWRHLRRMAA